MNKTYGECGWCGKPSLLQIPKLQGIVGSVYPTRAMGEKMGMLLCKSCRKERARG